MQIERTHHIDSSGPDEAGMYDYYYEYDVYCFSDGPFCLIARSYTDMPDEASFMSIAKNGKRRLLSKADLAHPLLLMAQAHLHDEGKTHLNWFNGKLSQYQPLPAIKPIQRPI